jgi:uracil-DNA glycosylase family 4
MKKLKTKNGIANIIKWYQSIGYYPFQINIQNVKNLNTQKDNNNKIPDTKITRPQILINQNTEIQCQNLNIPNNTDIASQHAEKQQKLQLLHQKILKTNCNLKNTATNTVFGCGNLHSDVMIIGEAPGEDEDIQAKPFVGKSGKLLENILNTVELPRENLYITNIIPWRPLFNRQPTIDEIKLCIENVEMEINIINPKILLLCGSTALKSIMDRNTAQNNDVNHDVSSIKSIGGDMINGIKIEVWQSNMINQGITSLRGKIFYYKNKFMQNTILCIPTFHPSYLLRSPTKKREAMIDSITLKNLINYIKNS